MRDQAKSPAQSRVQVLPELAPACRGAKSPRLHDDNVLDYLEHARKGGEVKLSEAADSPINQLSEPCLRQAHPIALR